MRGPKSSLHGTYLKRLVTSRDRSLLTKASLQGTGRNVDRRNPRQVRGGTGNSSAKGWSSSLAQARIRLTRSYLPPSARGAGSQQHQHRQDQTQGRARAGGGGEAEEEGCKVLGNSVLLEFSPEVFAKSPRQASLEI